MFLLILLLVVSVSVVLRIIIIVQHSISDNFRLLGLCVVLLFKFPAIYMCQTSAK